MFLLRPSRVFPRARRFMRVATGLELSLYVACLAAGSKQVFEPVIVGFELIVGDPPVLNGQIRVWKIPTVALTGACGELKIVRMKAVGLPVPVHHGPAQPRA